MQLKRYEAPTIQDAFRKIKSDLGNQAVIFDTRIKHIPSGNDLTSSCHRNRWVEVIAAVDRSAGKDVLSNAPDEITSSPPAEKDNSCTISRGFPDQPANKPYSGSQLYHKKKHPFNAFSELYYSWHSTLMDKGFTSEVSSYLLNQTVSVNRHPTDYTAMKQSLADTLTACVPVLSNPFFCNPCRKHVHVLVGPTGVGKTSTVLKLAHRYRSQQSVRLKIVSFDNHTLAASEQLKVYGSLMSINVAIAATPDELLYHIHKDDAEAVLVDTDGAGSNNGHTDGVLSWINDVEPVSVHLLLCASHSLLDHGKSIKQYSRFSPESVIVTKFDEAAVLGGACSTVISRQIPVSCITTGPHIPEDITYSDSPDFKQVLYRYFVDDDIK